ncbi:MAG: NACHT domain-containing protein [Acutalibacteraceae bacterium]|nr:NACHT domain-containing protein [Acutalibacteraceae bacterium]
MSEQEPSFAENLATLAVKTGSSSYGTSVAKSTNSVLALIGNALKKQYGKALVLTENVYIKYLHNAYERYNKIKTLATGSEPRNIIGKNNIYVQINVKNTTRNKEIDTSTIEPLLKVSKNLIIRGTGGAGKSMLFRYLFLNTINCGSYIPIFLELRKITDQNTDINGILNLIYNCMNDLDVTLDREQFEYSLRLGKYVFFLDGFDEIKGELLTQTAEAIQKFTSKYPKNSYIISSRPDRNFSPLQTFAILDCMDLSREQAIELSKKLGEDSEKTKEFCKQLDNSLYDDHKDFASNPLLLSMMFLTFIRNNTIPEHLADFYEKCYIALYSEHDSKNKGAFKREFQCTELDERSFKRLFSRFCFKTYFDSKYEFTEQELLDEMNWCIKKLGLESKVSAKEYVDDLSKILCIIIKDGNTYRFAHRSFQTYFAAVYTETQPDDSQRKLFYRLLSTDIFNRGYYKLLEQIEHKRFFINALLEGLNEIKLNCEKSENPYLSILKMLFHNLCISKSVIAISLDFESDDRELYFYNILDIFGSLFCKEAYTGPSGKLFQLEIIKKLPESEDGYSLDELDNCDWLNDEDRKKLYDDLIHIHRIDKMFNKIKEYIEKYTASPQKEEGNFFDAF